MRQEIAALTNRFADELMQLVSTEVQAKLSEALSKALGAATSPTVAPRRAPASKAKPQHANGVAPKGGKVRKPKPKGKRASNTKRTPEEIQTMKDQLFGYIKAHEGKRAEEIQADTGISTAELSLPLRALIAEKAIRHEGEARGRKYYAR